MFKGKKLDVITNSIPDLSTLISNNIITAESQQCIVVYGVAGHGGNFFLIFFFFKSF